MPTSPMTADRPATVPASAAAAPAPSCVACPHLRADHDAIGLRYCQATVTSALTRGCVCRAG
ncbi:RGCVC family protein [Modestobacter lapidis]|nr:hypothetical protein [Modestobacter lapidis]